MKLSDYIAKYIQNKSIKIVFGYQGGTIIDLIDSIETKSNIKFIQNYNEQASSFSANAYANLIDKTGISIASSGPGAINLIGGIANSYCDSIPCIYITGNVHLLGMKETSNIRQNNFQEIDIVSMVSEITKYSTRITKPLDIKYELEKAFYIANEGRKGPVLIDIPYNIARENIDISELRSFIKPQEDNYDFINVNEIKGILKNAKKPIILVGGGMRSNVCREKLKHFLTKIKIPVVASLCGLDVLSHNHECFIGFIGHYGNRYANLAVANSDCLIVLGSRLDERQLGGYRTQLSSDTKVIRVDIDKVELGRKIPETISLYSSTENFLDKLNKEDYANLNYSNWLNVLSSLKERYPSYAINSNNVNANDFIRYISDYLPKNAVICSDVGQNQMSVAQAIRLDDDRRIINSAGYASMGFSLPAAIGAAYATDKKVAIISVNGDGGLQMNIQELQTIKRDNLPINVILMNNNCLGMIRKTQEKLYNGRFYASVDGYANPNFEAIANAYEIPYLCIKTVNDYSKIKDFISMSSPRFIEVILPQNMENYPEPGDVIDRQNPLLSEDEMLKLEEEINYAIE